MTEVGHFKDNKKDGVTSIHYNSGQRMNVLYTQVNSKIGFLLRQSPWIELSRSRNPIFEFTWVYPNDCLETNQRFIKNTASSLLEMTAMDM